MGRELHLFEAHDCYVVRWTGGVSSGALLDHWVAVVEDPRIEAGFAALHDARGCAFKLEDGELASDARTYRADVEPELGFGRVAILSDDAGVRRGAQRLVTMLELEGALVTDDEAAARAWVGLPAGVALPYTV